VKIQFLKRERINDRLAEIYDYPLTIVEAPMGYGKTTAVRNYLEMKKIKPIWIIDGIRSAKRLANGIKAPAKH
jgi:LuxR family maltose regulon positive regulatory protein